MLRHFEEDEAHCVYCHAPASGPCARCRALICADCAVLAKGEVARAAICVRCDEEAEGGGWWGVLRWPLLAVVMLGLLAALLAWVAR